MKRVINKITVLYSLFKTDINKIISINALLNKNSIKIKNLKQIVPCKKGIKCKLDGNCEKFNELLAIEENLSELAKTTLYSFEELQYVLICNYRNLINDYCIRMIRK